MMKVVLDILTSLHRPVLYTAILLSWMDGVMLFFGFPFWGTLFWMSFAAVMISVVAEIARRRERKALAAVMVAMNIPLLAYAIQEQSFVIRIFFQLY